MSKDIKPYLAQLDPANGEHWTADGLPRLDVLKGLAGFAVTRDDLNKVAPGFTRKNAEVPGEKPVEQTPPQTTPEPANNEVDDRPEDGAGDEEESKDPTEDESESEGDEKHAARVELDEARKVFNAAQRRLKAATAAWDEFVKQEEEEASKVTHNTLRQRYQAKQMKLREAAMDREKRIREALKNID